MFQPTATNLIVFAVISLIIGEGLNYLSNYGGSTPRTFRLLVYSETDRAEVLSSRYKYLVLPKEEMPVYGLLYKFLIEWSPLHSAKIMTSKNIFDYQTEARIIDAIESDFKIKIEDSDGDSTELVNIDRVYNLLLSRIWSTMSPITRRYFYLNEAISNMRTIVIWSVPTLSSYILLSLYGLGDQASTLFAFLLIAFTGSTIILFHAIFTDIEDQFILYLLDDYYLSRLSESAVDDSTR